MTRSQKRLALAALSLATGWAIGTTLYRARRRWIGRVLNLPPAAHDVLIERNVRIPMLDGITLDAVHYRPAAEGAYPTILIRTPYGLPHEVPKVLATVNDFPAQRFAERGYHVIIQSVRGRFASEGEWVPLVNEAADGRATLNWIARQPWFNGALGLYGASYVGYVQWAVAVDAPPYVKAMLPMVTGSNLMSVFMPDNVFGLDTTLRWIFATVGLGDSRRQSTLRWLYCNSPLADKRYLQPAFAHLPLGDAAEVLVGQPVKFYRDWVEHADQRDSYWQAVDHGDQVKQVHVPAHLISGWYDVLLREVLADYAALRAAGRRPYLTIGPSVHADPRNVAVSVREGLAWFDAYLKCQPEQLRDQPVRIYVLGANEWREFDDWPPAFTPARYFLQAGWKLSIDAPVIDSVPDRYCYDPANPTPAVGGPMLNPPSGAMDNRALESRSDVVTYTTAPLQRDETVIGPVSVELYVRSSVAYTDFFARVCVVQPDGRSLNLCDGLYRIQPGRGEVQSDNSLKITIHLWPTANQFKRGERIRLQVSSGAHPRWTRNYGTAEPIATATRMLSADQTIFHDGAHPSALVLPLVSV
jgi:putative CocE/NonD family hydrolase